MPRARKTLTTAGKELDDRLWWTTVRPGLAQLESWPRKGRQPRCTTCHGLLIDGKCPMGHPQ